MYLQFIGLDAEVVVMQDEIYNFMSKGNNKNKWFYATSLAEKLDISPGTALRSLKGLYIRGYLNKKVAGTNGSRQDYKVR